MNHAKAKKAKKMSEDVLRMMALQEQIDAAQNAEADLQPVDGYVNPMGRMGVVPSVSYSPANMLNGTTTQSVINPET